MLPIKEIFVMFLVIWIGIFVVCIPNLLKTTSNEQYRKALRDSKEINARLAEEVKKSLQRIKTPSI